MEAVKQSEQNGFKTITGGQRTRISSWRMSFLGVTGFTVFYVVWGVVKMLS